MSEQTGIVAATAASAAACSTESHEALKADAVRFLDETDPIGTMADGADGLLLANCRRCQSTIARPMPPCAPRPEPDPPTPELAEAAARLRMTRGEVAVFLGICPRCGGDLVAGMCEACERQRRGERCCHSARRFSCFCAEAWDCVQHGTTHRGSHD